MTVRTGVVQAGGVRRGWEQKALGVMAYPANLALAGVAAFVLALGVVTWLSAVIATGRAGRRPQDRSTAGATDEAALPSLQRRESMVDLAHVRAGATLCTIARREIVGEATAVVRRAAEVGDVPRRPLSDRLPTGR
jgi:hypothetical protein